MVLRICVGSESSNSTGAGESNAGQGTTSFAYKKWHFEGQENVVDVVSCGEIYLHFYKNFIFKFKRFKSVSL
jgi:hypothetical protein